MLNFAALSNLGGCTSGNTAGTSLYNQPDMTAKRRVSKSTICETTVRSWLPRQSEVVLPITIMAVGFSSIAISATPRTLRELPLSKYLPSCSEGIEFRLPSRVGRGRPQVSTCSPRTSEIAARNTSVPLPLRGHDKAISTTERAPFALLRFAGGTNRRPVALSNSRRSLEELTRESVRPSQGIWRPRRLFRRPTSVRPNR